MKFINSFVLIALALLLATSLARAQQSPPSGQPEGLSGLLAEAERNNPELQAARHRWDAAKQVPTQVSTLPDPQFQIQQFSVGSPRPFAGYTNNDFAYIGLGVSQDFPYPGKLRLRGEIAGKEAEVAGEGYESVRRAVLAKVKAVYFELSYLSERETLLEGDRDLLQQIEQSAEAHYRSGMGTQQEVLQAQLEQTRLLREITANQLESGKAQAVLKQLLNRSQSSPDVAAARLSESPLSFTFDELLAAAIAGNPDIAGMQKIAEREKLQVDLARKDFYPDFTLQYMWQRTDPARFRAYYMLTFGVRVPIYRRRRQQPELAQAEAGQARAQKEYEAESQRIAAALREQYVSAEKSAELLKIYRGGLLPQARAELQAGLAAYQSNREDFQALLASFLDALTLDEEYWKTLSEHETSLARIEETSGLSLR